MLDLQARIHFHEKELHGFRLVVAALLDDEFHRPRAHVVDGTRCRNRRCAHLRAQGFCHAGGGSFFQHLLVAALHRTIALEQMQVIAMAVAKNLYLDMARALHIFFNQHRAVAKAAYRLALATRQRSGKVARALDDAHTLAAAARAGLDQNGIAHAVSLALQERRVLVGTVVAGHQRHTGARHQSLGLRLQAHGAHRTRRRADEHQARVQTGLRKVGVLAQKPVARMHRLRATGLRCGNDGVSAQIAVRCGRAADMHRLIAAPHMQGLRVRIRIHRHRADAHSPRRGCNPAGDFAPVGDEDGGEHG